MRRMRAIFRYVLITLRNFLHIRTELVPRIVVRLSSLGYCSPLCFTIRQDRDGFILIVMPLGALICFAGHTLEGLLESR